MHHAYHNSPAFQIRTLFKNEIAFGGVWSLFVEWPHKSRVILPLKLRGKFQQCAVVFLFFFDKRHMAGIFKLDRRCLTVKILN